MSVCLSGVTNGHETGVPGQAFANASDGIAGDACEVPSFLVSNGDHVNSNEILSEKSDGSSKIPISAVQMREPVVKLSNTVVSLSGTF